MAINGTPQADSLDDTGGDDQIDGLGGDDTIDVTNGHDEVEGGTGSDRLRIQWSAETAAIVTGAPAGGFDFRLVGGATRSVDFRGIENVEVEAGSGNDNFTMGATNDRILDGPRNVTGNLPTGNDVIGGGGGDDVIDVTNGNDKVDGGIGDDRIQINYYGSTVPVINAAALAGFDSRFESGAGRSIDLVGIEHIFINGSSANDIITTFGGDDLLGDGPGTSFDNDILNGGAGDDRIDTEAGHDVFDGGDGDDTGSLTWTDSTAAIVSVAPLAGFDMRFQSGANYSADFVRVEHVVIFAGTGNDNVTTGAGNDIYLDALAANSGSDFFGGGAGDDFQFVRTGNDKGDGGDGRDGVQIEWDDATTPIVNMAPSAGYEIRFQVNAGRSIELKNVEEINFFSGSGADTLNFGASRDFVFAGGGNDIVDGGGGDDFLEGDAGNDELSGGVGLDDLLGDAGNDTLNGGDDSDYLDGGANDDTLRGGDGNDFLVAGTGTDILFGDGGNDGFYFGASMTAADGADGGTGTDSLAIQGNYPGLTLGSVVNIDALVLFSGANTSFGDNANNRYDYNVTLTDANLAAGQTLIVQGKDLLPGEDLVLNASAETSGHFRMFAGQGTDTLTGGSGNDGFFFGADGNYTAADRVHGGPGLDSIGLRGNYNGAQAIVFDAAGFTGIDAIVVLSGHTREYGGPLAPGGFDYDLTMANGNVLAGQLMQIIGSTLGADESFRFDGRAETDGSFRILAGAGTDTLFGSSNADIVYGGLNADALDGGAGSDTYLYRSALESTSAATDSLVLGDGDRIDLSTIDATPADGNQAFTFIGAQAFGSVAGELRAYQSGGGLWIVEGDVDGNAVADLVINVTSADALVVGDFIP